MLTGMEGVGKERKEEEEVRVGGEGARCVAPAQSFLKERVSWRELSPGGKREGRAQLRG